MRKRQPHFIDFLGLPNIDKLVTIGFVSEGFSRASPAKREIANGRSTTSYIATCGWRKWPVGMSATEYW